MRGFKVKNLWSTRMFDYICSLGLVATNNNKNIGNKI